MLRREEVRRVSRGLYRVSDASVSEHETLAAVAARVPHAIVCLLTALQFHGIGTQVPRHIWIAIDRRARRPVLRRFPARIVRFSGPMLRYGVEKVTVQGVTTRITSPARTVVDCFRYRNKIGLDVALEALKDALRTKATTVDKIVRAAEICGVRSVIRPYLEAVLS
jgi:predicted transcriptional regulator of viral defense system